MKAGLIIVLAIIAVLIIAGVLLIQKQETGTSSNGGAGSSGGEEISNGQTGDNNVETLPKILETGANQQETPKTYNVRIENFAYSPATIRIKVGDKILWKNYDTARHTVTSDDGNEMNSELLNKGESYEHIFSTAGTYNYHCTPHPYIKGNIIVE